MDLYRDFVARMQERIDSGASARELENWARGELRTWLASHGDDAEVRHLIDRICETLDLMARASPDGEVMIEAVRNGLTKG